MSDHYTGALLEDMNHKFDVILEVLSTKASSAELKIIDQRLIRIKDNLEIMKLILTEESKIRRGHTETLTDHEIRITELEDDEPEYA